MQLLQRASLILVNHQQELLLIQRFQNDRHYWVFPGGRAGTNQTVRR
ncbi:NUDIX domain-containing protein [Vibrio parahaemolyticus]|nr:NUDIX domain-containing protein [Vibrio parahaemolyticus]